MVQRYCSFLVRCWSLADGQRRVRVEHVQSGEVLHAATLEVALAWMEARAAGALDDTPEATPDVPPPGQGTPEPDPDPGDH